MKKILSMIFIAASIQFAFAQEKIFAPNGKIINFDGREEAFIKRILMLK